MKTALDIQVREIAKTLRCTVCQTENIWESGAPLAQQMRGSHSGNVLALGHSKEEIGAYFLSRYGDYILTGTPQTWDKLAHLGGAISSPPHRRIFSLQGSHPLGEETPAPPHQPAPPLDDQARSRIEHELES